MSFKPNSLFSHLFVPLLTLNSLFSHAATLPDHDLTPGAIIPGVTAEQVCKRGYAGTVRNVPAAKKKAVYARYHMQNIRGADEVDHLISLELGGSNDITNLWPEPYAPEPGAHQKDLVENELHRRVCAGEMTLQDAQHVIATDWYSFYVGWKDGKIYVPEISTTTVE